MFNTTYTSSRLTLTWREKLQGTPCEGHITSNDENSLNCKLRLCISKIVTTCNTGDTEREDIESCLTMQVRNASARYIPGKVAVRTFLSKVLDDATAEYIRFLSAEKRASHKLIYLEKIAQDANLEDGWDVLLPDTKARDIVIEVAWNIDAPVAFKEAYKEPDLVLLMNALVESNGKRSGISEKLGWSDHKFRQKLGRLKELFKDFL